MFRFRLAKVLRWRQRRVEAESRALASAAAALRAVRAERAAVAAEIARLTREGDRRRRESADIAQWRLLAAWLTVQQDRLLAVELRERAATVAVAAQRERLLVAHREKEVLVRLEERQRAVWEEEERRRERRELDDVGGRRHAQARRVPPA